MPTPDCSYVSASDETRPTADDFAYCIAAEIRALKGRLPYIGTSAPTGSSRLWLDTNTGLWRIKFTDTDGTEQWISPKAAGGASSSSGVIREVISAASIFILTGGITLSHTLGSPPDQVNAYLQCISQDGNFPPGHRVYAPFCFSPATSFNSGNYINANSTHITIVPNRDVSSVFAWDTVASAWQSLTSTKWVLYLELIKYTG